MKKKITLRIQATIIGALLLSTMILVLPSAFTISLPPLPTAAFATINGGGVTCEGETATITGTNGNNDITGTSGRDVITALGGNDRVRSQGGDDVVCGGAGNDDMDGGEGRDELVGGAGNDRANGGAGSDICNAESEISCDEPDTTPPVITTVPEDITVQATSTDVAVVTFEVTAEDDADGTATRDENNMLIQDNVGGDIAISCEPPSGSEFPIGENVVECTATDAAGNPATATVTVTVTPAPDTTPPVITVPEDITVRGAASGAEITFEVTAEDDADGTATLEEDTTLTQDNVGGSITISCNPPSGSTFPPGSTDVDCTATDAAGNTATPASFTVTVQIICSNAPATIVGTNGNDDLTGTAGDDVIAGLGGDDTIEGLGLNDLICGNEGIDTVHGGDGNDILFGGSGPDIMNGDAGDDIMNGDAGDDIMNGDADRDEMRGLEGSDRIDGGNGPDVMFGGSGPDIMNGDAGDDIMNGDAGDDDMEGGDGSDGLVGGDGSDIMVGAPDPDHLNSIDGVVNNDRLDGGLGVDNCNSDPDPKENCELDA